MTNEQSGLNTDIVVIGGGPAGAAAARLVATWGYDTVLLAGPRHSRTRLWETLPPSCRKPLAALDLLDVVETGGFLPTRGNTAAWADATLHTVGYAGAEVGWQVERSRFDERLRDAAKAAGARVVYALADRVELPESSGEAAVRIPWRGADGAGVLRASWVLDCSGRGGVMARRGFRIRQPGPATLALLAGWRIAGDFSLPDESHTLVESYGDGWAWSVPMGAGRRLVAMMVDPRVSGLARGSRIEAIYHAELAKARHHRRLLARGSVVVGPWACTATPYTARTYAGSGFLLVGDAGSFLDPLSSFGVKKALASAWLAAVVVNTSLRKPANEGAALQLFDDRERTAHARYAELAARYYAEAAAHHGRPFWTSRAAAVASSGAASAGDIPSSPAPDSDRILRHPAVAAALDDLRRAPRLALRPSAALRRQALPMIRGREVVLEEHLVSPALPEGIRWVGRVELPGLVDVLSRHDEVPALYETMRQRQPNLALTDLLGALAVLVAFELVEVPAA